jgi:hypothetical protein
MHLERAHGRHQDNRVGDQSRIATLDVEEFLHPDVGAETALGYDIIRQLERDLVGDDGGVSMRDVRERSCVHKRRLAFERLH